MYGSGAVLRGALVNAKPWQRYLIAVGMIAAGVILTLLGHVASILLAGAGVLLLVRMLQFRYRQWRSPHHADEATATPPAKS
ncbi:MAG TPA: hypothetical protein VL961_06075 [Acidimicrobiales bacterium]|nr:hypothetical protein [Acidimicrobiales bacterium]